MVVTLNIASYGVDHVLIDNGSSLDVLFYDILKMDILPTLIGEMYETLTGFLGDQCLSRG